MDLTTRINKIFCDSLETIMNGKNYTLHNLVSDNLKTIITCDSNLCSDKLEEFSKSFNRLLNASQNNDCNIINAYVSENEDIFQKIESIFYNEDWSSNDRIAEFNIATHNTSAAKCTKDNEFYIIKCYEYFYYIYNTKTNQCLMIIKNEKKALTMVNILLLTPYLLYADLYAVHGGLVSNGKTNILISNSSLGGKTTFALLFLTNGWQIITEETTYITKHGEILNFNIRNYFNIRVGTYLEFKEFFDKLGFINDSFLSMAHVDKKELFELGKKEQMSIDFDSLCKNKNNITNNKITHSLKVSLDKDNLGMTIEKNCPTENVERFLELSLAPTVMLFKGLTDITNLNKNKRKEELMEIFTNVKSYSVSSGFDYKDNFDLLTQKIDL
ncbi:MAG: hypothetical protein ACM3O4_05470 [Ignavibacteriales bacterium]